MKICCLLFPFLLAVLPKPQTLQPLEIPPDSRPDAVTSHSIFFHQFYPLSGAFEPSGVVQLPDGRCLIVEDEAEYAMGILEFDPDWNAQYRRLALPEPIGVHFGEIEDLESAAIDPAGWIYAITSHSPKKSGKPDADREKLVRFQVGAGHWISPQLEPSLKAMIITRYPALNHLPSSQLPAPLNIEGLAFDPKANALLLGLREPLIEDRAVVVQIENPQAVFDRAEPPRLSPDPLLLTLDGGGIRSLCWDAAARGFWVLSQRNSDPFQLWFWSGSSEDEPKPVRWPGEFGEHRPEGITPVTIHGRRLLLVVSDEGDPDKDRPAAFALLDPDTFEIN